jgi:hypothetical protein
VSFGGPAHVAAAQPLAPLGLSFALVSACLRACPAHPALWVWGPGACPRGDSFLTSNAALAQAVRWHDVRGAQSLRGMHMIARSALGM